MHKSKNLVPVALWANAGFSAITGALLAIAPASVGSWLGVDIPGWLRLLGIALLGHAVVLAVVAGREDRRRWATLNLVAIAPYPLAMVGLVVTGLVDRPMGIALVLFDGAVVGWIAIAHLLGLRSGVARPHAQVA